MIIERFSFLFFYFSLQNFQNIITKKLSNNNWIYAKLYQLLSKIQIGNIKKLVKIIDKLSECEYCAHQHQQHKEYCSNMFLFLNNEKRRTQNLAHYKDDYIYYVVMHYGF